MAARFRVDPVPEVGPLVGPEPFDDVSPPPEDGPALAALRPLAAAAFSADRVGVSLRAAFFRASSALVGPGGGLGPQRVALVDGHDLVAAELAAQGRDRLHRRRVLLAGGEPGEQARPR